MWIVPSGLWLTCSPIRSSTVGSCASAGRYSLATIEGGTFQVGLTVMYFISAVMIGVGIVRLAVDDPRYPHLLAVVNDAQREIGKIDHHVALAEIVRHPAPAFQIGDDGIDRADPAGGR